MNTEPLLDKWDNAVIFYVKRDQNCNINGVKKIWAERCAIKEEDINIGIIFHHFFSIFNKLEIPNKEYLLFKMFEDANPDKMWGTREWITDLTEDERKAIGNFFAPPNLVINGRRYWELMLGSLLNQFRFLEVIYLEGFKEYADQKIQQGTQI